MNLKPQLLRQTESKIFPSGKKARKGIFKCECGNEFETLLSLVKTKRIKSCGCAKIKAVTKHGLSRTKIYGVWDGIRRRCEDTKFPSYKNYGALGIKMCKEWRNNPEEFCKWAYANGYKEGLQIDRINTFGNYEPSNCRFVSKAKNARNKKNSKYWIVKGKVFETSTEAAKYFSVTRRQIRTWCQGRADGKKNILPKAGCCTVQKYQDEMKVAV